MAKKSTNTLTPTETKELQRLAGLGLSVEQCANVMGYSRATLFRRIKDDPKCLRLYKIGKDQAAGKIAGKLFEQAMDGNVACIIFYLKTQCGWRETDHNTVADIPPITITVEK